MLIVSVYVKPAAFLFFNKGCVFVFTICQMFPFVCVCVYNCMPYTIQIARLSADVKLSVIYKVNSQAYMMSSLASVCVCVQDQEERYRARAREIERERK